MIFESIHWHRVLHNCPFSQKTFTLEGSMKVRLTPCLTGLHLTKQLKLISAQLNYAETCLWHLPQVDQSSFDESSSSRFYDNSVQLKFSSSSSSSAAAASSSSYAQNDWTPNNIFREKVFWTKLWSVLNTHGVAKKACRVTQPNLA